MNVTPFLIKPLSEYFNFTLAPSFYFLIWWNVSQAVINHDRYCHCSEYFHTKQALVLSQSSEFPVGNAHINQHHRF